MKVEITKIINSNQDWELTEIYADEGFTGTESSNRKGYNKLLKAIEKKEIDILVIKDTSRLGRNMMNTMIFLKTMYENDVELYYYLDRKFHDWDDDTHFLVNAMFAEKQSKDLSKNIKRSHKIRQQSGKIATNGKTWGLKQIKKEARLEIIEDEAEVIRYIFRRYIEGAGFRQLNIELKNILSDEIKKRRNIESISTGALARIIMQPLYKGVMIFNKTTTDFKSKKKIYNPESEWIVSLNACPAIISEQVWDEANRIKKSKTITRTKEEKAKINGYFSGTYTLSGKVYCGQCGKIYWINTRYGTPMRKCWQCSTFKSSNRKACSGYNILEDDLLRNVKKVIFKYITQKDDVINMVINILTETLEEPEKNDAESSEIKRNLKKYEKRLRNYEEMRADGELSKERYLERSNDVNKLINSAKSQILEISSRNGLVLDKIERFNNIKNKIEKTFENADSIDDETIKEVLDKVILHGDKNNKKLEIVLSTGYSEMCVGTHSGL